MTNDTEGSQENQSNDDGSFLEELRKQQGELTGVVHELGSQHIFMIQQLSHILAKVNLQEEGVRTTEQTIRQELARLQRSSSQRAMAAIFHKLFRDLLVVMNQLDELVETGETRRPISEREEDSSLESIRLIRGRFEQILKEWGCEPVSVEVNTTEFDSRLHEAIPPPPEFDTPILRDGQPVPDNTIVWVKRRGWQLHDIMLQYPQVVVN